MADIENKVAVTGICLDPNTYRALTQAITGISGSAALGNADRYQGADRDIARLLDKAQTKVCVIDYDTNINEALAATERLAVDRPDIFVFATSSRAEPEQIIAAMRAGCSEFLFKPLQSDRLLEAVTRVQSKQREKSRSKTRGKVISLIGAKGGTGVTSLALHLALELGGGGKRKCLLIDQHPALGDASLYLGTGRHQYSFYELASNTDRLDEELLRGFLLHHDSGLDLLDAPEVLEMAHYAPPGAVEDTLAFLAEMYTYVVVDCPPGLTEVTSACIAQSDHVAIVMTAELPSVRNTVRYLEHLSRLGYESNILQIVLNRHSKRGPLTDEKIEKALQRNISIRIPNSYAEVIRAINAGAPITSDQRSDFSGAIQDWARMLMTSRTATKEKSVAAKASSTGMLGIFSRG
jgi:pilus assembly protein CpaE